MRAFLGVPFPAAPDLVALARDLGASGADIKLVEPDQFHLTLKFLGEVPDSFAEVYLRLLRAETLPSAFDVTVKGVGAFPSVKRFTSLWAGLEGSEGSLWHLAAAAERAWVGSGGIPDGRIFQPHITVARTRSDRKAAAALAVLERYRGREFGTMRVDRANLYRSTLTPAGPVYDVVEAVTL